MEIHCDTWTDFENSIEMCVHKGLQFKAYTDTLIIKLTGGF